MTDKYIGFYLALDKIKDNFKARLITKSEYEEEIEFLFWKMGLERNEQ